MFGIFKDHNPCNGDHRQENPKRPFQCPLCRQELVFPVNSQGRRRLKHKEPSDCPFGVGETETHRQCKAEIYDALLRAPGVKEVEFERPLKEVRPDISAHIHGVPVAIEIQISNLPVETLIRRTEEYCRRGIYLLWLGQWIPALEGAAYSPKPWERFVHAMHFGRVYYWLGGSTVVSYHFAPYRIHVENRSWHTSKGKVMSAGGFNRISRRFKMPFRGDTLDLLKDFHRIDRNPWDSPEMRIPKAKLYCDSRPAFWDEELPAQKTRFHLG